MHYLSRFEYVQNMSLFFNFFPQSILNSSTNYISIISCSMPSTPFAIIDLHLRIYEKHFFKFYRNFENNSLKLSFFKNIERIKIRDALILKHLKKN